MKRLLYIILYVVLAVHASAQVKVTGRVMGLSPSSGGAGGGPKPVSDVIVKLVSGTKTLAFTSSNAKGEYSLELKSAPSGEVTLQFTHISYEKESERLTLKERVTKLDMILTPKSISLKEVTVKPDPLRQKGDTIGRDSFYSLLRANNLMLRKRYYRPRTTDSKQLLTASPQMNKL